jgi:transcriptional regulator with XRE-family HTH domain
MSSQPVTSDFDVYDFNGIVAENIRALAARRRRTQTDVARILGITSGAVSLKYSGRNPWSLSDIAKVAAYLGTTPWNLATPIDEESAQPKLSAVSDLYTARDSNPEPIDYAYDLVDDAPLTTVADLSLYRARLAA